MCSDAKNPDREHRLLGEERVCGEEKELKQERSPQEQISQIYAECEQQAEIQVLTDQVHSQPA